MSTFLMVSGASRGLGQAIAVAFAHSPLLIAASGKMEAVLLARSVGGGLEDTANAMQRARPLQSSSNLQVHTYAVDLGNLDTLERQMEPILERHSSSLRTTPIRKNNSPEDDCDDKAPPPSRAIFINCAGTTGYIGRTSNSAMSLQEIKQAVDLNVTSKAWLTTRFLQHFDSSDDACQETTVVNISSMCAIKPTPTMALYCATSAARDIFHTVLALDLQATTDEEEGGASTTTIASPQARILNYAPGSCDTDMQAMLREHDSLDPAVHAYCQSLVEESNSNDVNAKNHNGTGLVKCEDTANELVRRVLEPGTFQSGDRVEYTNMSTYNY